MLVLKDFSTSILAAPLSDTATSVVVGDAGRFPSLSAGSYFYAVLQKFSDRHQVEIVKVIGVSGNTFTLERAQAGTVAKQFTAGDYIELRLTVATFDEYIRQCVAGKVDSVDGVVHQTLSFENAGDGVRSSFGVRFSDHHETVIGGATGLNAVSPSLHLRPLGKDNKSVEATYTSDGVFSLFGGAAAVAARKLVLSSPDSAGWPNGVAASADNYARQWRSVVQANNSSLYLVGDGTLNARRFGFQVGNADPALAHEVGVLELNPYGGDVRVNGGTVYHTNFRPTPAAIGAYPLKGGRLDGHLLAKSFVAAESLDGQNWVGIEAADGDKPYISAKVNNVARRVIEFNSDGSASVLSNLRVDGEVRGVAFSTVGGHIRSNNASDVSLDGKNYSFVTSPLDAHLCQNSYWDGVNWNKYNANEVSGHLFVGQGKLRFHSSEAGNIDPNQNRFYVYHTGFKPTPAEIGAAAATEVYSKAHIEEKNWMRVPDLRNAVRPPNAFNERSISTWFNETGNPTAGWYSGINVRGWADTYASWELLSGSGVPFDQARDAYKTALWFRSGNGDTWGEFQKVYTTKHKPTPAEIGAIPTNTANGTPVAAYYTDAAIDRTGTKIRLPFNVASSKMVSFTVRVYQDYQTADIQFSGYLYSEVNNWYAPRAIMIAGSSQVSYAMGRDDDGRAYVWIGGNAYRGVGVFDVVGGYNQADWNTGWEISVSDHKPNLAMEGAVYPPYSPVNKPTSSDVGALPLAGGEMSGNIFLPNAHSRLNVTNGASIRYYNGNSTRFHTSVNGAGEFEISTGGDGETSIATIDYTGGMKTSKQGVLYGDRSKPTAREIGAAPDGFGVGGYCADIRTVLGDCNLRRQGGFFQGDNIEGMPTEGRAFKYVINLAHANSAGYFGYIAMDFDLNHAWLGGQADGRQKQKKFVFQRDRFIAMGATGSDYNDSSIEVNGSSGSVKPAIGFHQPSEFAGSIALWGAGDFRFHTQRLTDFAGIMVGLANVSDVYIRSDVRLKTNFVEMRGALDKLSLLQAYYYDKKGMLSSDDYNVHELGLKAQDVEAVEPVAVRRVEDSSGGEILSISGSAINAMLVQAINELRIRVEELEINARS